MANHTTPIDVVILANDGCYAMVCILDRVGQHDPYGGVTMLLFPSGGSDPRRPDGRHAEVHGEVLPSHLVREVRDEGPPRRDQQVRPRNPNITVPGSVQSNRIS